MKRNYLLFLLILAGSAVSGQTNVTILWQKMPVRENPDSIYFSFDRKLVWADFKGSPDFRSPAAAITESGFGYKMAMNSIGNRTNIVITVFCYFNKKKSWVKKGMNTNYALLHEQHHFDITYINTVLFVKKLKEAGITLGNYNRLVDQIYDECFDTLHTMQNDYDGQTSNGRIKPMQEAWNKKVDQMLESISIN